MVLQPTMGLSWAVDKEPLRDAASAGCTLGSAEGAALRPVRALRATAGFAYFHEGTRT